MQTQKYVNQSSEVLDPISKNKTLPSKVKFLYDDLSKKFALLDAIFYVL